MSFELALVLMLAAIFVLGFVSGFNARSLVSPPKPSLTPEPISLPFLISPLLAPKGDQAANDDFAKFEQAIKAIEDSGATNGAHPRKSGR